MGCSSGPDVIQDGLVLCLDAASKRSYNGSGTTWTDLSAVENSASLINGTAFDTANAGSLSFDGTDDYVSITAPHPQYETLIVWAKSNTENWNKYGWISSSRRENGHVIHPWQNSKLVRFYIANASASSNANFDANSNSSLAYTPSDITVPIMYTFTVESDTLRKMYINGSFVQQNTSTITRASSPTAQEWFFGLDHYGGGRYGNGHIYMVLNYNRALSADEIRQNYLSTKERFA